MGEQVGNPDCGFALQRELFGAPGLGYIKASGCPDGKVSVRDILAPDRSISMCVKVCLSRPDGRCSVSKEEYLGVLGPETQ